MDKSKESRELNDAELDKVAGGTGWNEEKYFINPDLCVECGACADTCPVGCISFANGHAVIDHECCIQCGTCEGECPTDAIYKR